jgi:hypothetical protein
MNVRGVNGVLQTLLTEPVALDAPPVKKPEKRANTFHTQTTDNPCNRSVTRARLGRPPQLSSRGTAREKVTFRIRPDLIEGYRDWSWDARMSVSHLVEAALDDYFTRRGR